MKAMIKRKDDMFIIEFYNDSWSKIDTFVVDFVYIERTAIKWLSRIVKKEVENE